MAASSLARSTVWLALGALGVALAALLVVRIYGKTRLAAAEREFAARVGPRASPARGPTCPVNENNAALFLRAGAGAMILPGNDKALVGEMSLTPPARWTDQDRTELRRILANNGPTLELLRRAGGMTKSDFGPLVRDEKTRELTAPPLLKLLTAQRLLLTDGRLALLDRAPGHLLADAASMATMAAALEREAPTVELLVGLACEKMLLSLVEETIADPSTERETLVKLQAMVPDVDLKGAWRRSNLWEQGEIESHVAEVLSDPLTAHRGKFSMYGRSLEFAFGDIFRAQQLELRAELIGAVDQPLGLDPAWTRRGLHRPRTFLDMFDVFESVMFGSTAKSAIGRVQSTLSLRKAARLALALRLVALQSGTYPPTLAGTLDAEEADPFAGKPLAYERRPDGSAIFSVPGFAALWKRSSDASPDTQPFTWELPAPQAAATGTPKR